MTDSNLTEPGASPGDDRPAPSGPVPAFPMDLLLVAVFVLLGRTSHREEHLLAGYAGAAWPFLSGALVGWAAVGLLRRGGRELPGPSFPVAAVVVAATVVVGMTLRRAFTDGGTPVSFLVAATTFLSILLFGWRAVARLGRRPASR